MASNTDIQRPAKERRVFNLTDCEVRTDDGGGTVFSGYAAVFNELSVNLGGFRERIQPGCFRNAVEEGQDVRFLINHDSNLILGRTRSGTVTLTEDAVGLRVECELGTQTYAQDLVESMRRGDINQMSFGFTTVADDWKVKDEETGLPIRELLEANLFDVSVVTYPAYPDTTAEVRSWIEEKTPSLLERAARAAEELEADEAEVVAPEAEVEETEETPEAPEAETPAEREETPEAEERDEADEAEAVAPEAEVEETREFPLPDVKAFREFVEERGWCYDDDWSVWTLTTMIESASCFLLYAKDEEGEPTAEGSAMSEIMARLAEMLAAFIAAEAGARDDATETEEREEPAQRSRSLDVERRRLALLERELEVL